MRGRARLCEARAGTGQGLEGQQAGRVRVPELRRPRGVGGSASGRGDAARGRAAASTRSFGRVHRGSSALGSLSCVPTLRWPSVPVSASLAKIASGHSPCRAPRETIRHSWAAESVRAERRCGQIDAAQEVGERRERGKELGVAPSASWSRQQRRLSPRRGRGVRAGERYRAASREAPKVSRAPPV